MEYKAKYGQNTKAGIMERALMRLVEEDPKTALLVQNYLDVASEESLERFYEITRRH